MITRIPEYRSGKKEFTSLNKDARPVAGKLFTEEYFKIVKNISAVLTTTGMSMTSLFISSFNAFFKFENKISLSEKFKTSSKLISFSMLLSPSNVLYAELSYKALVRF